MPDWTIEQFELPTSACTKPKEYSFPQRSLPRMAVGQVIDASVCGGAVHKDPFDRLMLATASSAKDS
jgi:hypothetical protein